MELLKGHTSKETAYLVNDYPYGFRLRCKIRYWLEYHPKHGIRFCSQTTNPKKGDVWNKEKCSTYCMISGAMFLNEENHVVWSGLSEYSDYAEAKAWNDTYREGVPEEALPALDKWLKMKEIYDRKKAEGLDYRQAGIEAVAEANGLKLKEKEV